MKNKVVLITNGRQGIVWEFDDETLAALRRESNSMGISVERLLLKFLKEGVRTLMLAQS